LLVRKELPGFFSPKKVAKDSRVDGGGVHGECWRIVDKCIVSSWALTR
jgi:hypothetical protein